MERFILMRDKDSELYDEGFSDFDDDKKIPVDAFEIIINGEVEHVDQEGSIGMWTTRNVFYNDENTRTFIQDLLNVQKGTLIERADKTNQLIDMYIEVYCNNYDMLPQDFDYGVRYEEEYLWPQDKEFIPIQYPYTINITYCDKDGKHFTVKGIHDKSKQEV